MVITVMYYFFSPFVCMTFATNHKASD